MRLVRRLDRYVLNEILGPLGLGFLVYTFILLLQLLFKMAEMIIRRGLPLRVVGELLLASLPNIVVLTIPMSLLFAILVAIGRLASDSELVAMRSCGVSLLYLYRPILALSALLTAVNVLLMVYALPWGNTAFVRLRMEILTKSATQEVQPRVFYEEWLGKVLYVFDASPRGRVWEGVFLADSLPTTLNEVTVAERGQLRIDERTSRIILHLENAVTHKLDLLDPDKYEVSSNRSMDVVVQDRFADPQVAAASVSRSVRERTLAELRQLEADTAADPAQRRLARVEVHKKFAIPFACLVFGLFALPLGFNNRRGSKSSGFALSIAVILGYYVLLANGEEAARVGTLAPWIAMWLPNLVLSAAGLFLSFRRNRDKSLLLARLDGWVRHRLVDRRAWWRERRRDQRERRRRRRREAGGPQVVLRLPRPRLRFPNLLDRYVLRLFGWSFLLVALSAVVIYVVADLTEIFDDVLRTGVGTRVLFDYYKFLALQIFFDIAPVTVLITTLVTYSLLSRTNEVTACKALGVSLYRLCLPALGGALLVALFCVFLQAQVLPASNQRVAQLKDRIKGREAARTYRRADRQWLFGQGRYIYNYLHYDDEPGAQSLQRLQVFEFDESARLVRRVFAASARYLGPGWVFSDSWVRTFDGGRLLSYERLPRPVEVLDYRETPDYFESEVKRPEQMSYRELRDHIAELRASGEAVPELEVEFYAKIALPIVSFVMGLVALPFAFRMGKRGALYGVGMAVVLGMVFMGVFAFFKTMGETATFPPAVAVWSPSVLFALLSGYLFLGVRT